MSNSRSRGRGRVPDPLNNPHFTRSRANREDSPVRSDPENIFTDNEQNNEPGTNFSQSRLAEHNTELQSEIERAQLGLQNVEISRRSEEGELSRSSVSADQVQKMIDQSMSAQTERLTELFNRVIVDQFASFRTPPNNITIPTVNIGNQPSQFPTQFNDSNYENHIPRQSMASHLLNPDNNIREQQGVRANVISSAPTNRSPNVPQVGNDGQSQHVIQNPIVQFELPNTTNTAQTSYHIPRPQNPPQYMRHPSSQTSFIPNPSAYSITPQNPSQVNSTTPTYSPNTSNVNRNIPNVNARHQTQIPVTENVFNQGQNYLHPQYPYYPYPPPQNPIYSKRGDLSNWDLKYDGKTSIERFIVKVDILRRANNLTWEYVVSQFHCLVKKLTSADRWYFSWMNRMQLDSIEVTWDLLREALVGHFGSAYSDEDITRWLNEKRQQPSEKFSDYFEEFMTIHDGLRNPKSDQELINILKRNVTNRLFQLTYNIEAPDVDSFRVKVCRVENDLDRRYQSYSYNSSKFKEAKKINELDECSDENPEEKEVDAINGFISRDGYKQNNSSFKDTKDVHCYKCGNPGFTVPTCPKCKNQENYVERGKSVGTSLSQ